MIEPPGGSPLRARPPLAPDGSSALFAYMSGGKESVIPAGGDAPRVLDGLVWSADVVLVDGTSSWQSQLPPLPEHVVEVDLSPWGRTGPYAAWRGSDIAVWAMGGYLYFTGSPDREPIYLPGGQAELHAGAHAAFAALAGVHERRRSQLGQRVEVSHLESVLTAHAWLVSSWAGNGMLLPRLPMDLIRASDGWFYSMRIVPYPDLFVMIERPDLGEEGLTDDLIKWNANIPRIFEAVGEWAKDRTVEEIIEFAQALRIAMTPVLDTQGLAEDPQMDARSWWEQADGDTLRFPGQPFHLSASPARRRSPAPPAGADTDTTVASLSPRGSRPARPVAANVAEPPLKDLKVVEVTANWAGPACGRYLADLGADVIKVEWPVRPATRALFWVGPTQDFQRQPHHRAMYFNEMNRNKRDVAIDLGAEEGREVLLDLVRQCDVLIENNSVRVMPNLGLGWEQLRQVNPRLIMVSMSGYGASGPRQNWSAYGSNIETTTGLTSVTGYPDGVLSRTTLYYADPVSGILGAVAAMAAVEYRRRTGEGQWIEMSLNECGAAFMAEPLLDYLANGVVRKPMANRDPRFAPQGVYPNAGDDNWVAISVQSDDDWVELAHAMGRPDLANDPELATTPGTLGPPRRARQGDRDLDRNPGAVRGGLGAPAARRVSRAGARQLAGSARSAHPPSRLLPEHRASGGRRLPHLDLAMEILPDPGPSRPAGSPVRGTQPPNLRRARVRRGAPRPSLRAAGYDRRAHRARVTHRTGVNRALSALPTSHGPAWRSPGRREPPRPGFPTPEPGIRDHPRCGAARPA